MESSQNRHRMRPRHKTRKFMFQRAILFALSSRDAIRLFALFVISFSLIQILLLSDPSLAPTSLLNSLNSDEINYEDRPYAPHIIVSEKNNLVFCPVPKAANTNWKYLIRKWEGMSDYADLTRAHLPQRSGLRYLSDYSPAEARSIITSKRFFKFAFVRHPHRRILSAYMDKFRNTDPEYVRREYRVFLAALIGWRRARAIDIHTAPRPTFADFVNALLDTPREEMNAHWMPQTILCGFDEIEYDFIGRMEHLDRDVGFVFRKINRTGLHFPTHDEIGFPPSGASEKLAKQVYTADLISKVQRIYEDDFRVLRYSSPTF